MKKLVFMSLVLQLAFLVACNKNDDCNSSGEINGKWEVKEFLPVESVYYTKIDDYNPIIDFKNDSTFDIRLDVNSCSGDYKLSNENAIQVSGAGCTEMCCDSDFSNKFIEMLPQVGTYSIEGNTLNLNVSGWGWIELEWISK